MPMDSAWKSDGFFCRGGAVRVCAPIPRCIEGPFDLGDSPVVIGLNVGKHSSAHSVERIVRAAQHRQLALVMSRHCSLVSVSEDNDPGVDCLGLSRRLGVELIRVQAVGPILFATLTRSQLRSANPRRLTRVCGSAVIGVHLSVRLPSLCGVPPGAHRSRSDLIRCSLGRPQRRSRKTARAR